MTITETKYMLPTKLQHIYNYLQNNHQSKKGSTLSHDVFSQLLRELHLCPPKIIDNNTYSEFTHHIFASYQQIRSQCEANSEGEYWLSLLLESSSSPFNQQFIECVSAHDTLSVLSSHTNKISQPRSGFSSKLLSPSTSIAALTKHKSATNSAIEAKEESSSNEITTDSDLDDAQFDILKQLPTWNKLKLSVYERRRRWRWRHKRKTTWQKIKAQQDETHATFIKKQIEKRPETETRPIELYPNIATYSDLDFSSHDEEEEDIIKGPSPPPRKMMSAELKAMCGNLINELISSPRSFYFRDCFPFDRWNLMDFSDYFVDNYLHLNVIKDKLEDDEYETPGLFAADVRTVFHQANLYHWNNAKQYRIKAKAMLLSDEFEEKYMDILREDEMSQKIRREIIESNTMNYDCGDDADIEVDSVSDDIMDEDIDEDLYEDEHDTERNEMMEQLQQLTLYTDMETIKETNNYINNIRLDLMIAQKMNLESPRLQKMRFLKQLHASQILMERKATDIISYRIEDPYHNIFSFCNVQSVNNSFISRASQTFFRAHDLSIRYAVNFPKSITITPNKKRRKTEELKDDIVDNIQQLQLALDLDIVEQGNESTEFEELPTEMTDTKLIEEHTDDLWAAMPLVPREILQKAKPMNGGMFVNNRNLFCDDIQSAELLLNDGYFTYTYGYIKAQFRTHFGSLRVGRDVFVCKLHEIFDAHQEFAWLRLYLPNYYVTPKSILPMNNYNQMHEKRAELYGLLQILQPKTANSSQMEMIYQHKQYLYELLKLSGVIQTEELHSISADEYDDFVLCLETLCDLEKYSDDDYDDKEYESYSEDEDILEMNDISIAVEDDRVMLPSDGAMHAKQSAMNAEYDRTNNQNNDNNNNNNNNEDTNNNNSPDDNDNNNSAGSNDNNANNNNNSQGDDGDEKKENDDTTNNNDHNEDNEEQQREEEDDDDAADARIQELLQEIQVIEAPDDIITGHNNYYIKWIIAGFVIGLIAIVIIPLNLLSFDDDYDSNEHHSFYQQAQDFLNIYDKELLKREIRATYKPYSVNIPDDHTSQSFLDGLHIGSLIDALDVESKWYTAYVTNIDIKTGKLKIHYDDWPNRFDEWVDPQTGKLAPYRTHAIGGQAQGGLPGRPLLPLKPGNDSILSPFYKMRLSMLKQQKTIPDILITVHDMQEMDEYKHILTPMFYDIGLIHNDRAVYMNRHKIYVSYFVFASEKQLWCVGTNYTNIDTALVCIRSSALRPELIVVSEQNTLAFKKASFSPAYIMHAKTRTKGKYAEIGQKGLKYIPKTRVNNKVMLPLVMVGTAGLSVPKAKEIIDAAPKLGYYMFDTGAQSMRNPLYYNHKYITNLFKIYGRATIGVSTKIPSFAHGYHATIHNFITQLHTLRTDYIDLVLIEHPQCMQGVECEGDWLDTWRALEFLYEKKRIRTLGVSEFSMKQLNLLIKHKQKHIPLSVVRHWRDPLHPNQAIVDWCAANEILFQAFSALGGQHLMKGVTINPVLNHQSIKDIAKKHDMKPAQVILQWNTKRGVGVVFKSSDLNHLSDNLDAFTYAKLPEKDLQTMDKLTRMNPESQKEPIVFNVDGSKVNVEHLKTKQKPKTGKTKQKENRKVDDDDAESVQLKDDL